MSDQETIKDLEAELDTAMKQNVAVTYEMLRLKHFIKRHHQDEYEIHCNRMGWK